MKPEDVEVPGYEIVRQVPFNSLCKEPSEGCRTFVELHLLFGGVIAYIFA